MSQKDLFLEIHRLSAFVQYNPGQVFETYEELKIYLRKHINELSDPDYFDIVELNFYLTIIVGKFTEAKISIDRLLDKFGDEQSERVAALKSVYLQFVGDNNKETIEYLDTRPANEFTTLKRRITLHKSNKDPESYIKGLNAFLKLSPSDIETWSELAETYAEIGHYDKAAFAYEETLMFQPFNYIVHGRLGELYHLLYLQNSTTTKPSKDAKAANNANLVTSFNFFSRSVELVSNFVRGWSGLYVVSHKLQELNLSDKTDYKKIHELSKSKLEEIIAKELASKKDIVSATKIISLYQDEKSESKK